VEPQRRAEVDEIERARRGEGGECSAGAELEIDLAQFDPFQVQVSASALKPALGSTPPKRTMSLCALS